MKSKSDDTFLLVKSLSKAEKGYFKKFAKGLEDKEDKNYILLFDILDKLDDYDESRVIKALEKKNKQHNLGVLKNYLYQLILRFLRSYHSEMDINTQIRNSINNYEILKHHGLISQARKVIDKTIEKAEVSNSLAYGIITKLHDLDLLVLEHEIQRYVPLSEEIIQRLKVFINLREIELLYIKIRELLFKKVPFRTKENNSKFDLLKEELLKVNESDQLTVYAQAMYFGCYYSLFTIDKDYLKAYEAQRKKYEIITQKDTFKLQNFHYQTTNHFHLILSLINLNEKFEPELLKQIELFKLRETNSQSAVSIKEKYIYEIELMLYLKNNDYSQNINKIHEIRDLFNNLAEHDQAKNHVLMLICLYYFHANKFNDLIDLLNKSIKNTYAEEEYANQIILRILLPLAHFELNNYKLISYMAENHSKHLKNRKILYKAEACIFNFLGRIENYLVPDQLLKQFELHLKELLKIIENPLEKNAFTQFDYIKWVEDKIKTLKKKN